MKNLCLILALVLASPAIAQTSDKVKETCTAISEAAHQYMGARQDGVSVVAVMETVDRIENPDLRDLLERLVLIAYEQPLMFTDETKERMIREYESQAYVECIRKSDY